MLFLLVFLLLDLFEFLLGPLQAELALRVPGPALLNLLAQRLVGRRVPLELLAQRVARRDAPAFDGLLQLRLEPLDVLVPLLEQVCG